MTTPNLTLIPGSGISDTHVSTHGLEPYAVATLTAALEDAWNAIRAQHPQIPRAVVILGPGTGNGGPTVHGHFSTLRWQHAQSGTDYSEVLVAGEGLNRSARDVFGTLLHEATHALADVLSIKDTSRQGRWHNKQFAKLAVQLGLCAEKNDQAGYSTEIPDLTAERYAPTITALDAAITMFRHPEVSKPKKKRDNSNNPIPVECACPRKIRVAPTVLEQGPITCEVCEQTFLPEGQPRDDKDAFMKHAFDPTGEHHGGTPTYPYHMAPKGLATIRQLRELGLRPGGQQIAAQILWRRGKRVAHLYRIDKAKPKRQATPAQLAAIGRALKARRICPTCRNEKDYYIPRYHGECYECAGVN